MDSKGPDSPSGADGGYEYPDEGQEPLVYGEEDGVGGGDEGYPEDDYAGYADADEDIDIHEDMPPFANEANKALHLKVKGEEALVSKQQAELDENMDRVGIMQDHLKNVKQEHGHTQALVDSKNRERETELHLKMLVDREVGRLRSDLQKSGKRSEDVQDKINSIQNNIFVADEKLEQFKLQMNWNEEELLQWSLAAKQKEEDQEALEKYKVQDNLKIKNLTLKMERLVQAVEVKKKQLNSAVTATQSIQIELDKTAEEYRKSHLERQDMTRQWNDAVEAMHRRDQAIATLAEDVMNAKHLNNLRKQELAGQNSMLDQEIAMTKTLQLNTDDKHRESEKKRELLQFQQKQLGEFTNEVEGQRNELEKADMELRKALAMNSSLQELMNEKKHRLEEFKELVVYTREQLKTEYTNTDHLSSEVNQIDTMYKEHQDLLTKTNRDLTDLKEAMFKHSHSLFALRKREADLIAEISGAQGTSRNLQSRIHTLDQRSLKQQEMLYNIEFQVQQLERRVAHASGKRSLEETLELKAQIAEQQKLLDKMQDQHRMIANQVKRLNDDLRAAKRNHRDTLKQKAVLEEVMNRIELENKSALQDVEEAVKEKEKLIVEHDTVKLSVKRLRDTLTTIADEVFALENRKHQLQLSMKEREKELQVHWDIQRAELKAAEEGRHKLTMDMRERQLKLTKLKAKYSTIAGKLRQDHHSSEEKSQAYYIIAAAQQREELQKKGDDLNKKIRKSEKEIRMLERTLAHLNKRNTSFRTSLQKADLRGPEAKLHHELEAQQRSVADSLYKQKNYLREIVTDYENRHQILAELMSNIGAISNETQQCEKELVLVTNAVKENESAVAGASAELNKAQTTYRTEKNVAPDEQTAEEVLMELRRRQGKNITLLNMLRGLVEAHSDLGEPLEDALSDVGLSVDGQILDNNNNRNNNNNSNTSSSRPVSSSSRPSSSRRGKRTSARGNGPPSYRASGKSSGRSSGRTSERKEAAEVKLPQLGRRANSNRTTPRRNGGRR